jgi:hypothetical protein
MKTFPGPRYSPVGGPVDSSLCRKGHVVKLRIGHGVAGAAALAAATIMATAGSASADEPPDGIVWDHTYTAPGVTVYVEEHGDIISVCDSAENGHSAWVQVDWSNGGFPATYKSTVTNGVGSCKTHQASEVGFDLDEGIYIKLAFEGDGSTLRTAQFLNDN